MRKQSETTTENMRIYVRNNDIGKAYRILNKKLHEEGFFKKLRDNQFHKTKGEKRREASRAGRSRWLKKQKQHEISFKEKKEINLGKREKPTKEIIDLLNPK